MTKHELYDRAKAAVSIVEHDEARNKRFTRFFHRISHWLHTNRTFADTWCEDGRFMIGDCCIECGARSNVREDAVGSLCIAMVGEEIRRKSGVKAISSYEALQEARKAKKNDHDET